MRGAAGGNKSNAQCVTASMLGSPSSCALGMVGEDDLRGERNRGGGEVLESPVNGIGDGETA